MQPPLYKSLALLALALTAFTSARAVEAFSNPQSEHLLRLAARQNGSSSCTLSTPVCSACKIPPCSSSSKLIRRLDNDVRGRGDLGYTNSSVGRRLQPRQDRIVKRVLKKVTQANVGKYLQKLSDAPNALDLAPYSSNGSDISFTRQLQFQDYINSTPPGIIMGVGPASLTGCAVLTIVSSRAVYMGHFWQSLAFISDNEDKDGPNSANLIENVLNLIQGRTPLYYAEGAALDTSLFTQPSDLPYAYFMAPRDLPNSNNSDQSQYLFYYPQIVQIETVIRQLIPNLQAFIIVPYIADDDDPTFYALYRRTAMFQYDPDADGMGNGNWRLFYEQTQDTGRARGQEVIPQAGSQVMHLAHEIV